MSPYEKAVALEEQNRLLAYLHSAPPLCGCPVVTLTWRHLIELSLAGNAFFNGRSPTVQDVEQLLWRISPAFRRPDGDLPNLDLLAIRRGAARPSRLTSVRAKMQAYVVSRQLAPHAAEAQIQPRLLALIQDRPAGRVADEEYVSPLLAVPTWFDYVSAEFAGWGHAKESVLDYGVAWTFQVLRAIGIKEGRAKAYIPPSAALFGKG